MKANSEAAAIKTTEQQKEKGVVASPHSLCLLGTRLDALQKVPHLMLSTVRKVTGSGPSFSLGFLINLQKTAYDITHLNKIQKSSVGRAR